MGVCVDYVIRREIFPEWVCASVCVNYVKGEKQRVCVCRLCEGMREIDRVCFCV